jgi:rhamnulose-1-phosphate aldolase/alcohol dehydrogenase
MSLATPIIAAVEDRWPANGEVPPDTLDALVMASHLLGADRAVANFGGGNTSAKGWTADHTGRQVETIWVKGSGSDLATMRRTDFTALRLAEIRLLLDRETMSDEEMVDYLACCQLDPRAPRSSIETLLHAFIPAPHVHHTHPDAVNALAGARDGRALVAECFGAEAAWIDYIRPGFTLAKQVAAAVIEEPSLRLVVLAKHGLVVWGETVEEAYRQTIAACNRAKEFVNQRAAEVPRFGGPRAGATADADTRVRMLRELLPVVRGALSEERSKLLVLDTSPPVIEFVDSREASALVSVGAACPDHLVHTKRLPLWIPFDAATDDPATLERRIRERAADYREAYRAYVARHAAATTISADPDARVVLIEGLGLLAAAPTLGGARLSRDLYRRAIEVMAGASALTGFVSLTEAESFAVEYWPLELYKLSLAPPLSELQGKVALITGAAGGIGRAIVRTLSAAGAAIVAYDLDAEGAADAVAPLGDRGLAVGGDVTAEDSVAHAFRAAVEAFGGVDIVVSNAGVASSAAVEETTLAEWERNQTILSTGYFLVAREAFRLLRRQDRGGAIVFVASKNGLVAGQNAAAYSTAKAAELHLARCLAEEGGSSGIRVNSVNPDAVLHQSRIWDSQWRAARAKAHGIAADALEEHYRRRTTLGVNIEPDDVAQAVLHFASVGRSGKSTGNLLNVDGGVAAAYPR